MLRLAQGCGIARRAGLLAAFCAVVALGALVAAGAASDQPEADAVGLIEGEDISVTGPMSVERVGGQTKTVLRSGSDVRVKSGQARISLVEGGQVTICGPAHFSVLKAGGSLTVALESGVMHAHLEREPALTVYTPLIQARPVAIGDDPRDVLVGFESPGLMCIGTYRGAMRVEQQLTGQSVIVPQGGDVLLTNGQIDTVANGGGRCHCEWEVAKAQPQAAPAPAPAPANPEPVAPSGEEATTAQRLTSSKYADPAPELPTPKEVPIYEVYMPPLVFDAKAKVQPQPDPKIMIIVKRLRVRPEMVFSGRVESEPVKTAAATAPLPPPQGATAAQKPPAQGDGSVVNRVRTFFRKLWTPSS